ncbi:hypothetical protein JCM6882_001863 [Rhodosporidiobolus microsporus]
MNASESITTKPRRDKAKLIQAGRLQGRRENREIDELNVTIVSLEKEVEDYKVKLAEANGKGKGGAEAKAQQKEVAELQKKIRRLESERDKALEERDALSSELKSAKSALDGDARLVKATKDLSDAQSQVSQLQARLKSVQEEGEIFKTRVRQLEQGATSTADLKRDKEKKSWEEKVAKMEDKVARLEADKVNLCGQLKAAKAKQDQLEQLKNALERDNGRLNKEVKDADVLAEKAEKALSDARLMSKTYSSGCTAEEKKQLVGRIAELEKLAKAHERRADELAAGEEPLTARPDMTSQSLRYRDLVENLRLTEDDVSTLLSEGPDWPPVRGQMRSSSLIDLLWLLQDEQDEVDDDKKAFQEKIAKLEQDVQRQKRRTEVVEAKAKAGLEEAREKAATAAAAGVRTPPDSRSNSPGRNGDAAKERERLLREDVASKDREAEKLHETIAQLEARVAAFESNDRSPSRVSSSRGPSISISGSQAQDFIKKLTKTVKQLTEEVTELREENTSLLLNMVGYE